MSRFARTRDRGAMSGRSGVGGGIFYPGTGVASLAALFDPIAANIVIATGVSTLKDTSGNGRDLTQATGASQPAYNATDAAFNNQPTVQTNGTTFMTSGAFAVALPISIYWVGLSSDAIGDGIVTCGSATNPVLIQTATPHLAMNNGSSVDSGIAVTGASAVVAMFHDGTDPTHSYVAVNNWRTAGVTGNASAGAGITALGLGAYANGNFKAAQKTAFWLIKAGLFSATELVALANYTTSRWGISVT